MKKTCILSLTLSLSVFCASAQNSEVFFGIGVSQHLKTKIGEYIGERFPYSVPGYYYELNTNTKPTSINISAGYRQRLGRYINFTFQGNFTSFYTNQTLYKLNISNYEYAKKDASLYMADPLISFYLIPQVNIEINKSRILAGPKMGFYYGISAYPYSNYTGPRRIADISFGINLSYSYQVNGHYSLFIDNNVNVIHYNYDYYLYHTNLYQGAIGVSYRFLKKEIKE